MPSPKRATRDAPPKSGGYNTPVITSIDALQILEAEQGPVEWEPRFDAVSELVFTILSQHNSDVNAFRAYDSLRDAFGSWDRVADADPEHIARIIWNGGLSRIKAPRIKAVLQDIRERRWPRCPWRAQRRGCESSQESVPRRLPSCCRLRWGCLRCPSTRTSTA